MRAVLPKSGWIKTAVDTKDTGVHTSVPVLTLKIPNKNHYQNTVSTMIIDESYTQEAVVELILINSS